ncbi:MAG: DUF711 family protein, partial [Chloroflexota bacterium]|nr:DUF711 family protein [Chloroflexota bacterium]
MDTSPIRTITLGIADAHPLTISIVQQAMQTLTEARKTYEDAGYEVQTVRLSTHSLFDDLHAWSAAEVLNYAHDLQHMLDDVQLAYCSVGTAFAARPDFSLARLDLIADLLATTSVLNATVQLAD